LKFIGVIKEKDCEGFRKHQKQPQAVVPAEDGVME
jgi:hypothetical protein